MQQTEKYHFNLIDPTDEFSPDPLNDNASKLETALNSHESAVETRLSAQDARIAETGLFRLGAATARSDNQTLTLNVSGVDQYAALVLFLRLGHSSGSYSIKVNETGMEVTGGLAAATQYVLMPAGESCTVCGYLSGYANSSKTDGYASAEVFSFAWSKIKSFSLSGEFLAGSRLALYGLKL